MAKIEFIAGGRRVINLFYGDEIHYRLEEIPAIEMLEVIDQISVLIGEIYDMRNESEEVRIVVDALMGESDEEVSPDLIFNVVPVLIKGANKQLSRFMTLLTKIPLSDLNKMSLGLYTKIIESVVLLYWESVTEMIESFKSVKKKAEDWREKRAREAAPKAVRKEEEAEPEKETVKMTSQG